MSEYQNPEPPPGGPGSAPPPPSYGGPSNPTPAVAPQPIRLAVNLLFALVAISLIGVLVSLTQTGAMRDQVRSTQPGFTAEQIDTAVTAGIVFAVVVGLILAALFLWLTFMIRKGANWARITLTVLFLIGILIQLSSLNGPSSALVKLISVIQILLEIGILVLLWQRPSTEFFAASSRRA